MKRRKFLKSILATAAAALVPFKIKSEPVFKLPSYRGIYPKMRSGSITTMMIDEVNQVPIMITSSKQAGELFGFGTEIHRISRKLD